MLLGNPQKTTCLVDEPPRNKETKCIRGRSDTFCFWEPNALTPKGASEANRTIGFYTTLLEGRTPASSIRSRADWTQRNYKTTLTVHQQRLNKLLTLQIHIKNNYGNSSCSSLNQEYWTIILLSSFTRKTILQHKIKRLSVDGLGILTHSFFVLVGF